MRKSDTKIQYLKYKVLREVARYGFEDNLDAAYYEIPKLIVKEKTDDALLHLQGARHPRRARQARAGRRSRTTPMSSRSSSIACDECPVSGYVVSRRLPRLSCTPLRGSLPPRRDHVLIISSMRTSTSANASSAASVRRVCPVQRHHQSQTSMRKRLQDQGHQHEQRGASRSAVSTTNKCISCGACVYQCPFGAIVDKSFILDADQPASRSSHEQSGLQGLRGRSTVYLQPVQLCKARPGHHAASSASASITSSEAALGADMVAYKEARRAGRKGLPHKFLLPGIRRLHQEELPDHGG